MWATYNGYLQLIMVAAAIMLNSLQYKKQTEKLVRKTKSNREIASVKQ